MSSFALVHGHWHGGWCWDRLAEVLEGRGHRCVAPDLPCTVANAGSSANARVVERAIAGMGDDIVLVGHSAGGLTVPLVAAGGRVRRMVFIAALLPVPGKSLASQFEEEPEIIDPGFEYVDTGDGFCSIDPPRAAGFFYNDCRPEDAAWAVGQLRPQTTLTITEPSPLRSWPEIPSTYIIGDQDRVIQPGWGRSAARRRLGADAIVIEGAGHSPFLSRPELVAELLLGAAGEAQPDPGGAGARGR